MMGVKSVQRAVLASLLVISVSGCNPRHKYDGFFPTNDGCYSYPGNIEFESVTWKGVTFNRGVTYGSCSLFTPGFVEVHADDIVECMELAIEYGVNSFTMHLGPCLLSNFWVSKSNPMFNMANKGSELYHPVNAEFAIEIYIADTIRDPTSDYDSLSPYKYLTEFEPFVKPYEEFVSLSISPDYRNISANFTFGGTACLILGHGIRKTGSTDVFYEDTYAQSPNGISMETEVDDWCGGDIYAYVGFYPYDIGDGLEVPEELRHYFRKDDEKEVSVQMLAVPGSANDTKIQINVTGSLENIASVSIKYSNEEAAFDITPIAAEMTHTYTKDDGNCLGLTARVLITDKFGCDLYDETIDRSDWYSNLGANFTAFDACSIFGASSSVTFNGITASRECSPTTIPIIKTNDEKAALLVAAGTDFTETWIGYKNYRSGWVWDDDFDPTVNTEIFNAFSPGDPAHGCSWTDISDSPKLTITTEDCDSSVEKNVVCWEYWPTT